MESNILFEGKYIFILSIRDHVPENILNFFNKTVIKTILKKLAGSLRKKLNVKFVFTFS